MKPKTLVQTTLILLLFIAQTLIIETTPTATIIEEYGDQYKRSPKRPHDHPHLKKKRRTRPRNPTRPGLGCDPFYHFLFGCCGLWPFRTSPSPNNPFLPTPRPRRPPPLPPPLPPPHLPPPPVVVPSPPPPPVVVPSPPPPPPPVPPPVPSPPPPVVFPPPPVVFPPPPVVFPPPPVVFPPPPVVFPPPPLVPSPPPPLYLPPIFLPQSPPPPPLVPSPPPPPTVYQLPPWLTPLLSPPSPPAFKMPPWLTPAPPLPFALPPPVSWQLPPIWPWSSPPPVSGGGDDMPPFLDPMLSPPPLVVDPFQSPPSWLPPRGGAPFWGVPIDPDQPPSSPLVPSPPFLP